MKPFTKLVLASCFAAILSLMQIGVEAQSPERDLEAMNAARDEAIAGNAAAIGALAGEVADLREAVEALGDGGGEDAWPAFLRDLETGALTPFEGGALDAPAGRYTVQIGRGETGADTLDAAPFESTVNGRACGPEQYPVYHICGNGNDMGLNEGVNTIVIRALGAGETRTLTVTIEESAPPTGPPDNGGGGETAFSTQIGPWAAMPASIEEPYVNLMRVTRNYWKGCGGEGEALFESGVVSRETGLPVKTPNGCSVHSEVLFPPFDTKRHWDGVWIAECNGDAKLDMWLPATHKKKIGRCKYEFTHDASIKDHTPLVVSDIREPFTSLKLYRKENAGAVAAGLIYNPVFTRAVAKYDIVRAMDIQSANGAVIRSVDDIATMASTQWGQSDWGAAVSDPWFQYEQPYQGTPFEAIFALAMEPDIQLWMQAPITLGAPEPFFDFRPDNDRRDIWAHRFGEAAGDVAPQVIESEEWDRYADAFVAALIESGYPADRPLYVSLANEVWNWAGHYFLTTKYAQQMGVGLRDYLDVPDAGISTGYGALVARFKLALDGALARASRDQNIVYVLEGQAANPATTANALRGAKAYMDRQGEAWGKHAPGFGVSPASYWGYNDQINGAGIDFNDLAALEALLLDGPESLLGTRANILKLFRDAAREGAKYGVRLIGAYEGGSHFTRPGNMNADKYREFIWGTRGGRVNYEINKALAQEFPGIILSNYALAGTPGGQPWFEGPLGATNPYATSWDQLKELDQ